MQVCGGMDQRVAPFAACLQWPVSFFGGEDEIYDDSLLASVQEQAQEAAKLTVDMDGDKLRLTHLYGTQLRRITVQDISGRPYDVLGTQSILHEPQGCFVARTVP
jgi:hypothetical protein